jgi:hypothetical protein
MTSEYVVSIAVGDLTAVRLVCRKCQAVVSLQFEKATRLPPTCVGCGAQWEAPSGLSMGHLVQLLLEAMRGWKNAEASHDPPFALRFELPPSEKPK